MWQGSLPHKNKRAEVFKKNKQNRKFLLSGMMIKKKNLKYEMKANKKMIVLVVSFSIKAYFKKKCGMV